LAENPKSVNFPSKLLPNLRLEEVGYIQEAVDFVLIAVVGSMEGCIGLNHRFNITNINMGQFAKM